MKVYDVPHRILLPGRLDMEPVMPEGAELENDMLWRCIDRAARVIMGTAQNRGQTAKCTPVKAGMATQGFIGACFSQSLQKTKASLQNHLSRASFTGVTFLEGVEINISLCFGHPLHNIAQD
jgi:hypothetical protein